MSTTNTHYFNANLLLFEQVKSIGSHRSKSTVSLACSKMDRQTAAGFVPHFPGRFFYPVEEILK